MDQMAGVSTAEAALFARAAAGQIPINGSLELTPLCNMNCDMCYVRWRSRAGCARRKNG